MGGATEKCEMLGLVWIVSAFVIYFAPVIGKRFKILTVLCSFREVLLNSLPRSGSLASYWKLFLLRSHLGADALIYRIT